MCPGPVRLIASQHEGVSAIPHDHNQTVRVSVQAFERALVALHLASYQPDGHFAISGLDIVAMLDALDSTDFPHGLVKIAVVPHRDKAVLVRLNKPSS